VKGGTREDINGRVHTKLIQKLQSGKIDVKKMIARQKAANEPLAPAGPSSLPRGPPRSQGSATDYSYDYNPQPSQPSRGVIYPNVPNVQLKSVGEIELNEIETIQPEENSTQNGSEKLIIMIGIGTGVIAVISLVIVLLIYFHRKIKKQEREDQEITQQKYMFDHTGNKFNLVNL
jgi:hypothetical protein